ncbi:MAG: hypothetical protein Q8942_19005 [Bacillota bacterium]|nr:hypothetical protein [Bacillota bacterium]
MNISESKQHDLLLAIVSLLFILLSTGLVAPSNAPSGTTIITSA